MSLFPARADQTPNNKHSQEDQSWLQNSSFQPCQETSSTSNDVIRKTCRNSSNTDEYSDNDSCVSKRRRKLKHQKAKVKKVKHDTSAEQTRNDTYFIDLKGDRELLSVDTIYRPSAPIYPLPFCSKQSSNIRKSKFKRYHKLMLQKKIENDEVFYAEQSRQAETSLVENFTTNSGLKEEEVLSGQTGHYSRSLTEKPDDVDMWLEYISFQDVVHQFEKSRRKGSIAKAQSVLAEKKLSIIEKALALNPNCEMLHREKLKIANAAFPTDELISYLEMLVDKNKSNIILWQGYIEATQCSMSLFNTASVMRLYSRCLSTLHQIRRASTMDRDTMEENILRMLYQCGLFLKQVGQLEHLWMLLKMYLDVNLAPTGPASMERGRFVFTSTLSEKQLAELEEVVFTSQLPLHELWLRIEKLRESCHWLPYTEPLNAENREGCSDPQRLVFAEDVAELVHPITIPENIFRLTAMVLALLKVPLLPCRHTTFQQLGFDHVPSSLDSIEPLLAVYYTLYPVDVADVGFLLDNISASTVGPQYLKTFPGSEAYLEFVLDVMNRCAGCLTGDARTAVIVWSFRLKRLLAVLAKLGYWKMDDRSKKNYLKKNIKQFLKKEDNRQNEVFYVEYALIEYELNNIDSCRNIINIALGMNNNREFNFKNWDEAQANRCCLFKHLVYLTLQATPQETNAALQYLCEMVLREKIHQVTPSVLTKAESEFHCGSAVLLQTEMKELKPVQHFQPDFFTDWLTCHAWFLYLYKGSTICQEFVAAILSQLEERDRLGGATLWYQEIIQELQVAVLLRHFQDHRPAAGMYQMLDQVLHSSVRKFPNNLFLLAALAKVQTISGAMGPRWWKVQKLLLHSERAFAVVFAVIIAMQRMHHASETAIDTITGYKYDTDCNMINRILALFKKVTNDAAITRKCGLIWRLYLQFVYTYSSSNVCRNVYYAAVEECPWLKALYVDAAVYIPAELHQIQDLIIEKQLRLHVTPEELDTLRS